MVKITLTNRNPHSRDRHVSINIATGICEFSDKREVELKCLLNELDFIHPLLTEPFTQASDHVFHYEYDNIDGLFYAGIYVYSTLLHVDNPLDCRFKINPSPSFQRSKYAGDIHFSINSHKLARESIRIERLEALVHSFTGIKFEFSEDIIINEQFTTADLPDSIDGDALYISERKILELLKLPSEFKRYELRYINLDMGLGVFARDTLKKGDVIGLYSGLKTHDNINGYAFKIGNDCLNMYLDARTFGNISRFINHAPSEDTNKNISHRAPLLEANVDSRHYYLNGIKVVYYIVNKEILKGEQLLVNYGVDFFQDTPIKRFKTNGRVIYPNKKFIWTKSQKKLNQLRIMADHGIKAAQVYLRLRTLGIAGVIAILTGILNYM